MTLSGIFDKNKDIVINTDIDGFLCGMILQKYYGCRVVGFSNSRETIWIQDGIDDINKPIYIDIYVANPKVICIDQHIIAFNKAHHEEIVSHRTKLNPNLLRKRTFVGDMESDYYHKYPFGTVHFLIALMEKEGINVELPNLTKSYKISQSGKYGQTISINAGHIILRADDALFSTLSAYRDNALDWWAWLDRKNEIPAIKELRNFIDNCDRSKAWGYKDNMTAFFKTLGCDGIDGAFDTVTDANGYLLPKVEAYKNVICKILGMELDLPELYKIHKGQYAIKMVRSHSNMDILHSKNLYSYAFIFGPGSKKDNFSYTTDLK